MPVADLVDGEIIVTTEFRDKDAIKLVPGARWIEAGRWRLPLAWSTCKTLRGVFGDRLTITDELSAWAWETKTTVIDPAMALRDALDAEGDMSLFPPQRAGVQWLRTVKRGLLGDPMGSGKTRQLLAAIPDDGWPVLAIVPNSVRTSWVREAKELGMDDVDIRVLDGTAAKRRKLLEGIEDGDRTLVIVNWEAVRTLSRLAPYGSIRLQRCPEHGGDNEKVTPAKCEVHPKALNEIPWRTVIRDEAHRAKDPKSKQTRASWSLQHAKTVRYCWDATGTPLAQHIGDLWTIMHGNSPMDFPRRSTFIDRYALTNWNTFGGVDIGGVNPHTAEELYSFLDPKFRHVPKEALLPFLPPKVYIEHVCSMTPKQAKAYGQMAEDMIAKLESGDVVTTNILSQYTRLMQFASCYAEVDEAGTVTLGDPSCKIDALMEIIGDVGNESIAVGMVSRQLLELCERRLTEAGITFVSVKGGQSMEDRSAAIDAFQAKRVQVILLTAQAGGVGITLTTAPYLVMLQRSWSLIDNQQLEDRVHRIGSEQHTQVTIINVVTDETLEIGRQIERLSEKGENLNEILRDPKIARDLVYGQPSHGALG